MILEEHQGKHKGKHSTQEQKWHFSDYGILKRNKTNLSNFRGYNKGKLFLKWYLEGSSWLCKISRLALGLQYYIRVFWKWLNSL